MPNLKTVVTAALKAILRDEGGRVIANLARRVKVGLQRRGGLIWTICFERQLNKGFFYSRALKLIRSFMHKLDLM